MWKYGDQTIREHRAWTDNDGIQHPRNWHIWSADEKAAAGLTEVTPETPPDSRLYTWSQNADGTISKKAKSLADVDVVDENGDPVLDDDDVQVVQLGVKSALKAEVNSQQGSLLASSDWYVIRKADKGTAIPDAVQDHRDAIRAKGDAMKAAIDGAADTAAVAALFVTWVDGNKSGILYDWPEIE
tara:strand:- start:2660 stop:3214 length:555 start_codon:yes stop_codon:yes gene_type:complete